MTVDLAKLIDLLVEFQSVERNIPIPKLNRRENDSEHSYNLALAAWLIIVQDKLPLDLDLTIKYALIHDLVEMYAGDTFALDEQQVAEKLNKEQAALLRLKNSELTADFAVLIERYEKLTDEESRFIYGLDKLMPAFTLTHGNVPLWKKHEISQQAWEQKFRAKVERSKHLKPYLDHLLKLQKANSHLLAP